MILIMGAAEYIDALNKNVDVTYSPTRSRGVSEAINSQRFSEEFDCQPVPLQEHFRQLV